MDDLVKQLRDDSGDWLTDLAADRIEELEAKGLANRVAIMKLEAKLAKAVEERDEALNQLDSARHSVEVLEKRVKTFCDGWGVADKGRIEAETKLAEAVEALRELIDHTHNCEKELTEELHKAYFCGESLPLTSARATLHAIIAAALAAQVERRKGGG